MMGKMGMSRRRRRLWELCRIQPIACMDMAIAFEHGQERAKVMVSEEGCELLDYIWVDEGLGEHSLRRDLFASFEEDLLRGWALRCTRVKGDLDEYWWGSCCK
jgi:hypothetical protein